MELNDMVLISVDEHICEPAEMYVNHLSGEDLKSAPTLKTMGDGTNYWEYQGMIMPQVGLNAVAGRPLEEYGMEPSAIDQLRKGVYDVHARIGDMNANGIAAAINFGTSVNFDGSKFIEAPDKAKALIHMRAYNDWHIDEWCGSYPGRFIPCVFLPTWDMRSTVEEIKRIRAKGCTSVSLNENPVKFGLPSIHDDYWQPMWKALVENDITICLHTGVGNRQVHASMDTPIEAWITTLPLACSIGAADWLQLQALNKYPDMRICLAECGIGWIPYFLERADFSHSRHRAWTNSNLIFKGRKPSEVFLKHFMVSFIGDAFGLKNLDAINEDMVAFETDYPHADTLWPESPERLWSEIRHLSDLQIDKITHMNAMRYFNFDLFKSCKRDDLTVGSLRSEAREAGVDITPRSSGGAKPLAAEKGIRVVTSGDLLSMYSNHGKIMGG